MAYSDDKEKFESLEEAPSETESYADSQETKIEQSKFNIDSEVQGQDSDINQQFSSVAQSGASKKFLIAALAIVATATLYFVYSNFKSETKTVQTPSQIIQERSKTTDEKVIDTAKRQIADNQQSQSAPTPPPVSEPPPLEAPKAPEPPPAPAPSAPQSPVFPSLGTPGTSSASDIPPPVFQGSNAPSLESKLSGPSDEEKRKALDARRKSSIMVLSGDAAKADKDKDKKTDDKDSSDKDKDKDKKADSSSTKKDKTAFLGFGEGAFGEATLPKTSAAQISATHIGKLDTIIAQGKVINAVLENAVNTDLPGSLRAIVSRDVYSESGNNVLIPKGSRVLGSYEADVKSGQTRVAVTWDRVIRPDGVDIRIASNGTDPLGRSGLAGYLDSKLISKLGNAIMISYLIPVISNKLFKVDKNSPTTSTSVQNATTGTTATTQTSTVGAQQAKESSDKFNEIIGKAIEDSVSTKPVLYIDQGTEITILVNQDLIFPTDGANNRLIK